MLSYPVVAPLFLLLEFIRNLVTITFSAVGGSSEELLDDMILQLQCHFGVGALAVICLACIVMDVLLCMRVHVVEYTFAIMAAFVFIWYKAKTASATDSKPSSTRRSTAEQTMMIV
jgi:hypothetical protein